jgi:aerobic C4-dicarboxylate transport protein
MKKVGRVGAKALIYFEVVSTAALAIGLIVVNVIKPGAGFNAGRGDARRRRPVETYAKGRRQPIDDRFLLHVIPKTFTDAFTASGDLLQVLLVAVLFGYAMNHLGVVGRSVHTFIDECARIFFAMMNAIMRLAPIGAGGAMAFTIGNYGLVALKPLAALMGSFYLTCLLFILVVLGAIAARRASASSGSSCTSATNS